MRSASHRDSRINPDDLKIELYRLRKDVKLLQDNVILLQEQLQQSYKTIQRLTELQTMYKEK